MLHLIKNKFFKKTLKEGGVVREQGGNMRSAYAGNADCKLIGSTDGKPGCSTTSGCFWCYSTGMCVGSRNECPD